MSNNNNTPSFFVYRSRCFNLISGSRTRKREKPVERDDDDDDGGILNVSEMCVAAVSEIKLFYLVWFISFVYLRLPLFILVVVVVLCQAKC